MFSRDLAQTLWRLGAQTLGLEVKLADVPTELMLVLKWSRGKKAPEQCWLSLCPAAMSD